MNATLTMVSLAKIKTRHGFNPRTEFADDRMAELVASVKRHGIITPLTLAPDGDGFVIVAGEYNHSIQPALSAYEERSFVLEMSFSSSFTRSARAGASCRWSIGTMSST